MSKLESKTIKQRIEALEAIIAWFESEEFELEEGIKKYQQAHKLAQAIINDIETMKHKITVIKES